jgi:hypothetical protein
MLEFPLPFSCLFFLHFLPTFIIFLNIWLFIAIGSIHQEAQAVNLNCSCTSGFTDCSCLLPLSSSIVSCTSGILKLPLSTTNVQFQLLAVLQDFSGFNCLLPTSKFNCNCTYKLLIDPKKLFNQMNLCENLKSLIISINLCNVKNMIHLSNLELDELSSLFSRRDLRDSSFQDTIIKVL